MGEIIIRQPQLLVTFVRIRASIYDEQQESKLNAELTMAPSRQLLASADGQQDAVNLEPDVPLR